MISLSLSYHGLYSHFIMTIIVLLFGNVRNIQGLRRYAPAPFHGKKFILACVALTEHHPAMDSKTQSDRSSKIGPHRYAGIDALRGIAVILMIQQHMLAWLWDSPKIPFGKLLREYPLSMGLNLLGNLAAPLFVTLAGMGACLFLDRAEARTRTLVMRGACIVLLGFALNLLAPFWFGPCTWYVLHLIGLCLMLSPALSRIPSPALAALALLLFAATPIAQTLLGTPIYLPETRLNDASLSGGIARLALAEGHFPVLPWMAFFILGMIAHRFARTRERGRVFVAAAGLVAAGIALALLYRRGHAFATYGPLYRAFVFAPYFFPPHLPLMLMLSGAALACTTGAASLSTGGNGAAVRALARFGRAPLSLLFFHTLIFNTLVHLLGLYRIFSNYTSWLIISGFLLASAAALVPWSRRGYARGLERLERLPERYLFR